MGISLHVHDGHAWQGTEDWGIVYDRDDPLPCCGCPVGGGRSAVICDECRCHDMYRMAWRLPPRSTA